MKKYRLKKSLPSLKAGSIFSKWWSESNYKCGSYYFTEDEIKDPDWFQEVGDDELNIDPDKLFPPQEHEECKHERVTKIGDALTTGVYVKCDKCDFQKFRPFKPKPSKLIKSRLPRGGL